MEYLYTGMRLALCGFLNLQHGGMTVTKYHKRWTSGKELIEDFGYKIGESSRATYQECKANLIKATDDDYDKKRA